MECEIRCERFDVGGHLVPRGGCFALSTIGQFEEGAVQFCIADKVHTATGKTGGETDVGDSAQIDRV